MVNLKLYPGEHHSLLVQNDVLTLSACVHAVWDCIDAGGLVGKVIDDEIGSAWKEGYDEAWEEQDSKIDGLNAVINDLNSKIEEQDEELEQLRLMLALGMKEKNP